MAQICLLCRRVRGSGDDACHPTQGAPAARGRGPGRRAGTATAPIRLRAATATRARSGRHVHEHAGRARPGGRRGRSSPRTTSFDCAAWRQRGCGGAIPEQERHLAAPTPAASSSSDPKEILVPGRHAFQTHQPGRLGHGLQGQVPRAVVAACPPDAADRAGHGQPGECRHAQAIAQLRADSIGRSRLGGDVVGGSGRWMKSGKLRGRSTGVVRHTSEPMPRPPGPGLRCARKS